MRFAPASGEVMKVSPGQVLSGTLRLVRRIAEGGMGSVWVAEHLVLGTQVAVKVMCRAWAEMPDAPARFLREARITARIDSPHVVRVLDCRRTEADEPYLVLELLRGETLEERVRRGGPVSVPEVLALVTQAAEGLAAAHAAGVLHRDLKPENVFLVADREPFVKLLDFGVARPTERAEWLDADRLPAGTPQYMSPEQLFEPETADERADLFSLAAVAYFALTGHAPLPSGSLEALAIAADAGAFRVASTLRPELPPAIDAWLARGLARAPGDRFRDARAMACALAAACERHAGAAFGAPDPSDMSMAIPTTATARALVGLTRAAGHRSWTRNAVVGFGAASVTFVLAAGLASGLLHRAPPSARADVALRAEPAHYSRTSPPPDVGSVRACR